MSNSMKEALWLAYWQGYKRGYGVEEMEPIDRRCARTNFNNWYNVESQ